MLFGMQMFCTKIRGWFRNTHLTALLFPGGGSLGEPPSMTSGQQWTKRFHDGSRTDLGRNAECTKTKIDDLFCFLSKQDMMKLYVDAQRKRDQKSMIRVFPLGHAFRLPWGIFHTLQWQCTYQVSYTHVTTKLQPFAEMIYFALPSFGSKSHQPTMEPWNRRKFPH